MGVQGRSVLVHKSHHVSFVRPLACEVLRFMSGNVVKRAGQTFLSLMSSCLHSFSSFSANAAAVFGRDDAARTAFHDRS